MLVLAYLALCTAVSAVPPPLFLSSLCPSMMRSVSHDTSDGSVRLETTTPVPSLRRGDVLIKVHCMLQFSSCGQLLNFLQVAATAVNRADLLQAKGHYPPPPGESKILGLESSLSVCPKHNTVIQNTTLFC